MYRVAAEMAGLKTQKKGRIENESPPLNVENFLEDFESALDRGETHSPLIDIIGQIPDMQSVTMVDILEEMSLSEDVRIQLLAIEKIHCALGLAVARGELANEHMDRMRDALVDLMTSPYEQVREHAIAAYEERYQVIKENDTTTMEWLGRYAVRLVPLQIHGDSYYIRLKQLEEKQKRTAA